ncbi:MAG TPA: hypothetical protein VN677_12610 [Gemmatimonadaceae bacterium]|nr:hypothetical protein [Gemmatimonadaceae bacterium]
MDTEPFPSRLFRQGDRDPTRHFSTLTRLIIIAPMRRTNLLHALTTKLSAIVRRIHEGHRIAVEGNPAVVIRPTAAEASDLNARLAELVERGVVIRPAQPAIRSGLVARRPGALKRFLDDGRE